MKPTASSSLAAKMTVFLDRNGNGKADKGEESGKTDANGAFTFVAAPGEFVVTALTPKGFVPTQGATGYEHDSQSGDSFSSQNFGYARPGVISGLKFEDLNGDGILNGKEKGLRDVVVYLDLNENGVLDGNDPFATTDSKGKFSFNVAPGTYDVREVVAEGLVQTAPEGDFYDEVVVSSGATVADRNFGNYRLGTVTGLKFNDLDGDSKFDKNETGLAGVTVRLFAAVGDVVGDEVGNTVTDADGGFTFEFVDPGRYFVKEDTPAGTTQTLPGTEVGGYFIEVTSGAAVTQDVNRKLLQFGNVEPATLSGVKFEDLNGNGVLDGGEPGIEGVTIFLDANRNGRLDAGERTTLTDVNGEYEFEVGPGKHTVALKG